MGATSSAMTEEQWLKVEPKTSSSNAPTFTSEHCLSPDSVAAAKASLEQLNRSSREVIHTPPIDDSRIVCWNLQDKYLSRASDHFLVIVAADAQTRRIEIDFTPFNDISSDVFGWSYRWATPVEHADLVEVHVFDHASKNLLYHTNIFEMELLMLAQDVQQLKKVWIDKVCVPQKSKYAGYHIAAMGVFYQNATTVLREVRNPNGLPFYDYLSRAWTYQEARYGKTLCDNVPSIYLAREWAEMLWGRQFVLGLSGLLYQIPNIMARSMDIKTGPNNITFEAMRNCIGSGHFFQFFVKKFRQHAGFPAEKNNCKYLAFLEEMGSLVGSELDAKLHHAFWNLPREAVNVEAQGKTFKVGLIGPNDCRLHPEMTGVFWIEVVKMRNRTVLNIDSSCAPEIIAEMSLRKATFDSDRFIGTWAVLLKHMKVDIVTDERSYPLPAETWQRVVASYQNGLLKRPELAFMLYGPADIAGMRPVGEQLPSAITGGGSSWRIERLMCERVVAGIGDGSIDEINTFPDLRNAWAVHVSDNEEVSVLLRHDIANSSSAYRRIAVVGRELAKVHPGLKNQICGLFQLGISALIDIEHTARALSTSQHQISNGLSHIAGTFREYLQRLVEGGQPGPEGVYNKSLSSKYCIPSDATDHELTPLREHVFLLDKMSKKKENRCWTRFEMLDVLVAT